MTTIDPVLIDHSIRNFVSIVSYGNPVPHWHDYSGLDIAGLASLLDARMQAFLEGEQEPPPPLKVAIPEAAGTVRTWIVPSVFDQIILEALSSAMAEGIQPALEDQVYSYRLTEGDLALYEDLFSSWEQFQADTVDALASNNTPVLLKVDLEQAFAEIDRDQLMTFVQEHSQNPDAAMLFQLLVDSLDPNGVGLPHINDSTFFVGNAFLSRADTIIASITDEFIRYVDDYHIFVATPEEAEQVKNELLQQLPVAGFRLNESKTRILKLADYGASTREAPDGLVEEFQYLSVPIGGLPKASMQLEYVKTAVTNSDRYMTKGFGRLTLGFIRRTRSVGGEEHTTYLSRAKEEGVADAAMDLLTELWQQGDSQTWRLLWLLYMLHDFASDLAVVDRLRTLPEAGVDELPRLWRNRLLKQARAPEVSHEFHGMGYLEEGRELYGG